MTITVQHIATRRDVDVLKLSHCKRMFSDSSGLAALEFAILLPLIALLLMGTVELSRYYTFERHLLLTTESMSRYVASRKVAVDSLFVRGIDYFTYWMIPERVMYTNAQAVNWTTIDETIGIVLNVSGVAMTPTVSGCTTSCTYTGAVKWHLNPAGSNSYIRGCSNTQNGAATASTIPNNTIPSSYLRQGGLVIVDMMVTYTPLFKTIIPLKFNVWATSYALPLNYPDTYLPSLNAVGLASASADWQTYFTLCP